MLDFIKRHKKLFAAFLVAVLTAFIALINGLSACTSSGMWKADLKRYPEPKYEFSAPKEDISELGGFEQ